MPVVKYTYDAWGNFKKIICKNCLVAYSNPFIYKGYFFDEETKWYYLKSRYYDPSIRRFINADDINYLEPESLTGLNLYSYCGNNPVLGYDPEGTWNWKKFWTGFFMVLTAASAITLSIATFGAATPVAMTIIASVTLGAGVLTGINGVATMIEARTEYNFVRDGVFNELGWSDSAYNVFASVTMGIAN